MNWAHTPGPLFVGSMNDRQYVIDRRPKSSNDYPDHNADVEIVATPFSARGATVEANARRLAAAWNACEGISTEALEQWLTPPGGSLGAPHGTWSSQLFAMWETQALEKSRHDELIEVVKKTAAKLEGDGDEWGCAAELRAVIAKTTGARS